MKTQWCLPLFLPSLKVCQQTEHERESEGEEDGKEGEEEMSKRAKSESETK